MKNRAVFVTNIPAPYRERVHQALSEQLAGDYHVVYAAEREPNREWDVESCRYDRSFLRERYITYRGRYIHVNPDLWTTLKRLDPQVVITTGFNPTMLLAFMWCMHNRRSHVSFADSWLGSERGLSLLHRLARRRVYAGSKAFIGASRHALDLFRSYGLDDSRLFRSYLCVDNELYARELGRPRQFDLLFSGRISDGKMPMFFADVARRVKRQRNDVRVLILGDGPQREQLLSRLRADAIDFTYAGFVSQRELPAHYASVRLLLFPTRQEAWGIVANEACAAGVPVITCRNAGVVDDLIVDGHNGLVLELDPATWSESIGRLLRDEHLREQMSRNAIARVQEYTFDRAASGISDAVAFASR